MRGQPANILSAIDERRLLAIVTRGYQPRRGIVMVLLTLNAGLRACEISALTWGMICTARLEIDTHIELPARAAKKGSGRRIPMHRDLRAALMRLAPNKQSRKGPVAKSKQGGCMSSKAIVNWFTALYRTANLQGCSSHSGRRTFVTRAARLITRVGGSLRDVQQLAGHRSIETTQGYIEGDAQAQRRLMRLM